MNYKYYIYNENTDHVLAIHTNKKDAQKELKLFQRVLPGQYDDYVITQVYN